MVRIQHALEEHRFRLDCLAIEPIGATPTRGAHYELLLRLEDESGETVAPGVFLPAAERYNLSSRIDRWVIANALAWLKDHPRHLDELYLCAINVSGPSLGT